MAVKMKKTGFILGGLAALALVACKETPKKVEPQPEVEQSIEQIAEPQMLDMSFKCSCQESLDTERQPVLDAMESELKRSKEKLRMAGYVRPYFISYHLRAIEEKEIWGNFGSSKVNNDKKYLMRVEIRVGNYFYDGIGEAGVQVPSLDRYAIKRALWITSDTAIKIAEEEYYSKKAMEINAISEYDSLDDFSREKPSTCLSNDVKLHLDDNLDEVVKRASAEFNSEEDIVNSDVIIKGEKVTNYFINTEGTKLVTAATFYSATVGASLLTEKGEDISTFRIFKYLTADELPDESRLKKAVSEVIEELKALKNAPKLSPVSVPTILDQANSGTFWHEVIGHRLEGPRQIDEHEGGTFRKKIGKKITSGLVTLVDNPTLAVFKGMTLYGYYCYDDEGIPAQKVVLIDKGTLKNYMMSRLPIPKYSHSNGHGRSGTPYEDDKYIPAPFARMSNTMLVPEKTVEFSELKKMAAEEAIKQGKPFYLILRGSRGGLTATSAFNDFQAFKGVPMLVYKVDAKTGKETLVRPVEFIGTPLNILSEIVAFGNDSEADNGYCGAESGWVPVSTISPSMLVRRIEVQNTSLDPWEYLFGDHSPTTPPILPPPKP